MAFRSSLARLLVLFSAILLVHAQFPTCPSPNQICQASLRKGKESQCGNRGKLAPKAKYTNLRQCTASVQQCRQLCHEDKRCVSLGYGNGVCSLYTKPIEGMGFTKDNSSPQQYYNKDCFTFTNCRALGGASTSSTSTTSTTSSSTPPAFPSATAIVPGLANGFRLGVAPGSGSKVDGQFVAHDTSDVGAYFTGSIQSASTFNINASSHLIDSASGGVAYVILFDPAENQIVNFYPLYSPGGRAVGSCSLGGVLQDRLRCDFGGATDFQDCPGDDGVGGGGGFSEKLWVRDGVANGCDGVQLVALPLP